MVCIIYSLSVYTLPINGMGCRLSQNYKSLATYKTLAMFAQSRQFVKSLGKIIGKSSATFAKSLATFAKSSATFPQSLATFAKSLLNHRLRLLNPWLRLLNRRLRSLNRRLRFLNPWLLPATFPKSLATPKSVCC